MRTSRWLSVALLVVGSAAPIGVAERAGADGSGRVGTFGAAGTVALTAAAGTNIFLDAVVTDDLQGRILVLAEQDPNLYPYASASITRLLPDGRVDATFGTGGVVAVPVGKYGARLAGIEVLPDGRIVYGTGQTTFSAGVFILSPDGANDGSVPLFVPPNVGANDFERLPDGGVLVGAGGLQPRSSAGAWCRRSVGDGLVVSLGGCCR